MRKWRTPLVTVLAFIALAASTLPSQGWYCPATGHIGSAALVCRDAPQSCARPGSRCCHPVSLPPADTTPQTEDHRSVLAVLPSLLSQFDGTPAPVQYDSLAATLPISIPALIIPGYQSHIVVPDDSFYLCGLHGPPPFAGRAPPQFAAAPH